MPGSKDKGNRNIKDNTSDIRRISRKRVNNKINEVIHMNIICPYCGCTMIWQSDFNFYEVFGEGAGIVSYYYCFNCGCDAEFSLRTDKEEE